MTPGTQQTVKELEMKGISAAGVLGIIVIVLVLASCSSNRSATTGTSPGAAEVNLSGNFDDWLAAVCKPGSYENGGRKIFRNSNAGGSCMPANGQGGIILIGEWDSNFVMTNDLTALRIKYYASWTDGQSPKAFVPYGSVTGAELEPLTRFGFSVNHL
jgi:hypothetical protein